MSKKLDNVTLDYERLLEELKKQGKTKTWLSVEIGRSVSYISCLSKKGESPVVPNNLEALISRTLGYEPGAFIRTEKKSNSLDSGHALILEKLYDNQMALFEKMDKCLDQIAYIERKVDTLGRECELDKKHNNIVDDHLEFIRSKSNANTVQLAAIKEMLLEIDNGNLDTMDRIMEEIRTMIEETKEASPIPITTNPLRKKAYDFLENVIDVNGIEQSIIFTKADEEKIPKKELLRAKNELGIQVISRGIGKSSKKYWCK